MHGVAIQVQPLLCDRDQHVSANRDPQLRLHGVLAGAKERLDAQVTLDPLEEQLDLPTLSVQIGNQRRRQRQVVREKHQPFARIVFDYHPSQRCGIIFEPCGQRQHTRLVADQTCVPPIHRVRVAPLELGIAFCTCDEESLSLMQRVQTRKIQITPVHQIERTRLPRHQVHDIDFVGLAVGDVHERWNVASKIDSRVQFHSRFGGAKRRPREDRQTQIDGARIEGVDRLVQIQSKGLSRVERTRHADEVLGEVAVDLPRAHGVRVGQGVARDGVAAKAHVIQLVRVGAQIDLDVSQRFAPRQLGKGHRQELVETTEVLNLVVAPMRIDATSKSAQWQMRHELCKNELALMHKSLRRLRAQSPQSGARCSNRHQTKMLNLTSISLTYKVSMLKRWDTTDLI